MPVARPAVPSGAAAIEVVRLVKDYGSVLAVDGIDLRVEQGDVFGFLGPNGAGKTTTIRVLLDLIRPTAGVARIMGFDAQRQSLEARRQVGFLPSDPVFYSGMTASDYFAFVGTAHPVDRAYRDALVRELELPDRPIRTLSRGNRQKVGIIAALMHRPPVVMMDEPTSGLDPFMQEAVMELVRDVARDGRTVFFSSHLLPEVEAVCHRAAILRGGRIVGNFDLAEQKQLAPRLVSVRFATPPPDGAFAALPGVRETGRAGAVVSFELHGSIDALVKLLGRFAVEQIESREPTLEDLFMSYYEHDEAAEPGER